MDDSMRWNLGEGDEISPGRFALSSLGGGHRYEAYLAWDEDLHHVVVAKLIRPHLANNETVLRAMETEARMIRTLQHPVLLRCFDLVMERPRPHLVLEHLEGPRLSTLLRKQRRLALEQIIPLGVGVASALVYMHNHGFVHLDVKPRNIIMCAPPRLIDMSVARSFDDARAAVQPIGTDPYMAPEQCHPGLYGWMGPKCDVWGWGATLYEAATGTLPFPRVPKASKIADRFPQLHLEPAPMGPDIPPALSELVMACLNKVPDDRPDQATVTAELEKLMTALPKRIVLSRLRPRAR